MRLPLGTGGCRAAAAAAGAAGLFAVLLLGAESLEPRAGRCTAAAGHCGPLLAALRAPGAEAEARASAEARAELLRLSAVAGNATCPVAELNVPDEARRAAGTFAHDRPGSGHHRGRLGSPQGWSAHVREARGDLWYEMDAEGVVAMAGVVTQGRAPANAAELAHRQWVSLFRCRVSSDGVHWSDVDGGREFAAELAAGGPDGRAVAVFSAPVVARFLRIQPTACVHHCSLRAALLVCASSGTSLADYTALAKCGKPAAPAARPIEQILGDVPIAEALRLIGAAVDAFDATGAKRCGTCTASESVRSRAEQLQRQPEWRGQCLLSFASGAPTPDGHSLASVAGRRELGLSADDIALGLLQIDADRALARGATWLGVPLEQHPNDFFAMQQLLWHKQIDLVVEIGVHPAQRAGHGLWHAMKLFAPWGSVLTVAPPSVGYPGCGSAADCPPGVQDLPSPLPPGRTALSRPADDPAVLAGMRRAMAKRRVFVTVAAPPAAGGDPGDKERRTAALLALLQAYAVIIPIGGWLLCQGTALARLGKDDVPARAVRAFIESGADWEADPAAEAPQIFSRHAAGWLRRSGERQPITLRRRPPLRPPPEDETAAALRQQGWDALAVLSASDALAALRRALRDRDADCARSGSAPGAAAGCGTLRSAIRRALPAAAESAARSRDGICAAPRADPGLTAVPGGEQPVTVRGRRLRVDDVVFGFDQLHDKLRLFSRTSWLGVPMQQNAADWWIMQEIMWRQKVDLVIELGTNTGGGSIGFWHVMREYAPHGHVLTVDPRMLVSWDRGGECVGCHSLDRHPLWPLARAGECHCCAAADAECIRALPACACNMTAGRGGIVRVRGRGTWAGVMAVARDLASKAAAVFVTEDSSHSYGMVLDHMRAFAPLVQPGGYMLCQDTKLDRLRGTRRRKMHPMDAVDSFLAEHPEFSSDRDMERFVYSQHHRGWLRRGPPNSNATAPRRARRAGRRGRAAPG